MNSRRTVIIAAALVLALIAFLGNVYYLKSADTRAYGKVKLVQVYVVAKDIPKGLDGTAAASQGYVRPSEIPVRFKAASAIKSLDDIKDKVAINNLSVGQIVVDGHFVPRNEAQVTTARQVPSGQVAVSVSLDSIRGVSGLLMPGDKIDLMVVGQENIGTGQNKPGVSVLYQNINILAIGTKTSASMESTSNSDNKQQEQTAKNIVTLAVPLDAAQRIVYASTLNDMSLYAVLVPPDNKALDANPPVITLENLLGTPATPYPAG